MSWRSRTVPWIVAGLSMGLCPRRASAQPLDSPSTPPVDVDSEGAAAPVREAKMDEGTRTALVIAGLSSFGVGYLAPTIIGATYDFADQGGWTLIPVAGPIVTVIARQGCGGDPPSRECTGLDRLIDPGLISASLLQAAGIGMLLGGILYEPKADQPVELNPVFSTSGIGIELRRAW